MSSKTGETIANKDEPKQPVQRTLTETYHPNGERVYEYSSETHTVRISAVNGTPKSYTGVLLRKLAGWLDQTPPPADDPWTPVTDEPPF